MSCRRVGKKGNHDRITDNPTIRAAFEIEIGSRSHFLIHNNTDLVSYVTIHVAGPFLPVICLEIPLYIVWTTSEINSSSCLFAFPLLFSLFSSTWRLSMLGQYQLLAQLVTLTSVASP
ncbi:uncharacterized protein BJ212DRAFT_1378182 [Suillus subaureus]|uniref:Uncharacterized protein n=1 Tax=Suillus subaureus TaxID=48587 RepID=A0A9P7J9Z2_9AGAM|nr:uncharacterized protein BJ212DRAFT_1378182 [Suillus subaureus]KAG1810695.1 hypothetical protein BJ212DRAFT_1378182 [Suillus subaureus]